MTKLSNPEINYADSLHRLLCLMSVGYKGRIAHRLANGHVQYNGEEMTETEWKKAIDSSGIDPYKNLEESINRLKQ